MGAGCQEKVAGKLSVSGSQDRPGGDPDTLDGAGSSLAHCAQCWTALLVEDCLPRKGFSASFRLQSCSLLRSRIGKQDAWAFFELCGPKPYPLNRRATGSSPPPTSAKC